MSWYWYQILSDNVKDVCTEPEKLAIALTNYWSTSNIRRHQYNNYFSRGTCLKEGDRFESISNNFNSSPLWRLVIWMYTCVSLNHRKVNTFHYGLRDTRAFMPTLAYRCTSILVLAIPCQQLPPGARTPACTVGCQRLPPGNANSRLAERDARGCSKSQITNRTFIIGIHSRSGQ